MNYEYNNDFESWKCGDDLIAQFCMDIPQVYNGSIYCLYYNSTFAGSNSSNPRMRLRNTITYVAVVRPGKLEGTTGYLETDCSDGSVLINFYD